MPAAACSHGATCDWLPMQGIPNSQDAESESDVDPEEDGDGFRTRLRQQAAARIFAGYEFNRDGCRLLGSTLGYRDRVDPQWSGLRVVKLVPDQPAVLRPAAGDASDHIVFAAAAFSVLARTAAHGYGSPLHTVCQPFVAILFSIRSRSLLSFAWIGFSMMLYCGACSRHRKTASIS